MGAEMAAAAATETPAEAVRPGRQKIIRQNLADARAAGRDDLTQTELAVRAVCQARPDMTASEALVELVRRLLERGDMGGCAVWKRILAAV